MKWVAFVVLAVLAGCQSKSVSEMSYGELQEYVAELQKRCAEQGVRDDQQMRDCALQEARSDEAKRQNAIRTRQAVGMAMAGMGQGMQRSAAIYQPTVTCRSTPSSTWVGGPVSSVRTTCY